MLSLKQRKFIARYLETGNATEAAFLAYEVKNRNVAGVIGCQNLKKLNIRHEIDDVLKLAGLTNGAIARSLRKIIDTGSIKGLKLALKLQGYKIN